MRAPLLISNLKRTFLLSTLFTSLGAAVLAEDTYYHETISSLTFIEGALPVGAEPRNFDWQRAPLFQPYAVLDGEGEVYVGGDNLGPWRPPDQVYRSATLVARAPKGKDVTGRLFVPKSDVSGMTILKFKLGSQAEKRNSKEEFFKAKQSHYRRLRERDIPGSAWFRH